MGGPALGAPLHPGCPRAQLLPQHEMCVKGVGDEKDRCDPLPARFLPPPHCAVSASLFGPLKSAIMAQ